MNRPPTPPSTASAKPTGEQTPPPYLKDRDRLGLVGAVDLAAGDLYRHDDPTHQARDRAEHGSDLWIVTAPFDLDALDRGEDSDLHACLAGQPYRADPEHLPRPDEDVDRVAVLQHETSGHVAHGYELIRIYQLSQHTVRVRVVRVYDRYEDRRHRSSATADMLTPAGWSELLTHPADHWPLGSSFYTDDTPLRPLAERLIADAHRVLTSLTPPPAPSDTAGDGNPPPTPRGQDNTERRLRACTRRVLGRLRWPVD
ncbi:hypothetical protein CC117_25780 [Parafrankia colletiae]|uniref:Uncharacterized protein n=1 Tax=Parafrankia colletiae TaxID=573497 RepID=A0A1S1QDA1_9ACTN|nr:hypothetical protein [Parafrankia colletiae]MCK9903601.1 hypothetical protein [Frankia sp. Cpl3]OHV31627.1 hypothetical protein CC117_25780 [Parafrankia colletiae]